MQKRAALPHSEHAFQVMVCEYLALALRLELYWSAIENRRRRRNLSVAVRLKC